MTGTLRRESGGSPGRQQQQQQPNNIRSTRVWLERCLFFAIGALATMGILYGHKVERYHHDIESAMLGTQNVFTGNTGIRARPSGNERESLRSSARDEVQQSTRATLLMFADERRNRRATNKIVTIENQQPQQEESSKPQQQHVDDQQGQQQSQQQESKPLQEQGDDQQGQQLQKEESKPQQVQDDDQQGQQEAEDETQKLSLLRSMKNDTSSKTTSASSKKDQLNVVLFYADDWTQKVLGKLNPDVHTPNIDKMADNGMLFTNNCVTTSVCWMSRATLMTGVYSSRHLQSEPHVEGMFQTNPWSETLFPLLRSAGYYTGIIGKWHAPQLEPEMSQAFDEHHRLYFGDHWMDVGEGRRRHVTDLNQEDAIKFLQNRPRNQSFALKVSFYATHAMDGHFPSYEPINATRSTYYPNNVTIAPPRTATEQAWKDLPPFFGDTNEGRNRWRKRFDPEYFQDSIKALYSMATEVDWAVGEIIEELKRQGVYENTVLIFTTDNGNLHGEHGLAEKWYPFEESIRVPLVIQDPRMPQEVRGTISDAMTLNIDLAPTILGAANIRPSAFMQGQDIGRLYVPKKRGNQTSGNVKWRKEWFYEFNMGNPITADGHPGMGWIDASFALITAEWKYVLWPQQKYEQLFHRSVDPYDEFDLLDQRKNHTDGLTTLAVYENMKARFKKLKQRVQSGHRV